MGLFRAAAGGLRGLGLRRGRMAGFLGDEGAFTEVRVLLPRGADTAAGEGEGAAGKSSAVGCGPSSTSSLRLGHKGIALSTPSKALYIEMKDSR